MMVIDPYRFGSGAGGDPYAGNVKLLVHFDGADESTTFTDVTGKSVSTIGNAQVDTAQSKFGASGLFPYVGAASRIEVAASADFAFDADFTIEGWVRFIAGSGNRLIYSQPGDTVNLWIRTTGVFDLGVMQLYVYGNEFTGSTTLVENTWYHIAAVREGTAMRLYLDGVLELSGANGTVIAGETAKVWLGGSASPLTAAQSAGCWLDDWRVTKGVCRYSANFTPPSGAYPDP